MCFQFNVILIGYDLMGFIDGTRPCPPPLLNNTTNLEYSLWAKTRSTHPQCHHCLFHSHSHFVHCVHTNLPRGLEHFANTYDNLTKGTQSITKYLQSIRTIFDKFIMFNTSPDHEEFILQILGGIDDDYKDLYSTLLIHESPITFNKLHEQLLNDEVHLKYEAEKNSSKTPISPYPTFKLPHKPNPITNIDHLPIILKNQSVHPSIQNKVIHPSIQTKVVHPFIKTITLFFPPTTY